MVTYRKGRYYTLDHPFTPDGRGCVKQKEAEKIATRIDGTIADHGVYNAKYHVIAKSPFPKVKPVEFIRVLQRVRFADGSLVGKLHGPNTVQKFRARRRIHRDSAKMLDRSLRAQK